MRLPWNSCVNTSGNAVNHGKRHISMHWGIEFMHLSTWPFKKRKKKLKMYEKTFLCSFSILPTQTLVQTFSKRFLIFFFFFFCHRGSKEKSQPKAARYHVSGLDRGNHCQKWWGRPQGNTVPQSGPRGTSDDKVWGEWEKSERRNGTRKAGKGAVWTGLFTVNLVSVI